MKAIRKLIKFLDEAENSIFALSAPENELKVIQQVKEKAWKIYTEEEKETENWKKRCLAAERVIRSMEPGNTTFRNDGDMIHHEEIYNKWITIKKEFKS